MAFVHHQPRQQRRDRQDHVVDPPSATYAIPQHRHEREVLQDWSIVFPGRSREPPVQVASSTHSSNLPPPSPSTDHTGDTDPLALTLPPLHDGTGRFLASPLSPSSTGVASFDAPLHDNNADDDRLSEARHSEDVFPESVFSGTDSQLDADEELGFGSGSDFDFESDAVASSHPSRSSARRGARRAPSRRRPSKLSQVSIGSDDDESHSHMFGSKAWSLFGRSKVLERVPESPSASTQLYSSARSSRQLVRPRRTANELPVVFTSGSEREDDDGGQDLDRFRAATARHATDAAYDAGLAVSNLAESAGLSHLDHSDLLRRPKRRHRRSAAGRSSKRSNTSQSLLSIDYESRLLTAQHHAAHSRRHVDGAETPKSSSQASRMVQEHPSKTSRVIGSILRKVFDLEPDVLDAFLHEDAERQQRSGVQQHHATVAPRPGFAFEAADTPLASVPLGDAATTLAVGGMMLDGTGEQELWQASSVGETETDDQVLAAAVLDPATSPLFSNSKPVEGEETADSSGWRLTEAALLQRGSVSTRRASGSPSLTEPTTMEALSAFMNTMVMPVPMPLRLLGALLGWSSIWTSKTHSNEHNPAEIAAAAVEEEQASRDAEEERKYRYERLLSAQQAKAWSRRYRGILFANVDDEEPSPDVPELWRGEEHPAIAGHQDD
ncbi:uncharacterized protein SPSC_00781 [Sporisorium scitamineum]|uniref:Uncharacterized protein n=1 Tax=Sporisorium scitamineum TaxID=49012 RepID=A0A0F7RUZ9_9BASI|nr:hypothetical protein [Sporisorium scitamineum]CDU22151.1 uncharacterized protein SPSC_00781 [Sporisorium scitamineum]